jgi:hypothetical protein
MAYQNIFFTLKWPSLIAKKQKKSLFYEEKCLIGLTPGLFFQTLTKFQRIQCLALRVHRTRRHERQRLRLQITLRENIQSILFSVADVSVKS